MELINLWYFLVVILFYDFLIIFYNLFIFFGFVLEIVFLILFYKFLIGLRFGDWVGYFIILILLVWN